MAGQSMFGILLVSGWRAWELPQGKKIPSGSEMPGYVGMPPGAVVVAVPPCSGPSAGDQRSDYMYAPKHL